MTAPTARILDVTAEEYHQQPGFSSSIAKTLISRSPLHAKSDYSKKPTKAMDTGNVVHRLVLGKGKSYAVLRFDDWRTNAAKAARDKAREEGFVPILDEAFEEANVIAESIRVQFADHGIVLDGASEVAIEWTETTKHGDVMCRGMLDHVWISKGAIMDLKITADAGNDAVERTSYNLGYAIQQAAYSRALARLRPDLAGRVHFQFAFCEAEKPYAMNLVEFDGMFRELGERQWMRAVNTWAECTATDKWPGYGTDINRLTVPPWALAREGYSNEDRP